MISRQFILFVVVGGIAAVANFASRIGFSTLMPYVPAIVLAYCVGMITAFALNRRFVFADATNTVRHQAMWFVIVNAAAILQTVLVSLLLRDWLFPLIGFDFHPETIAHGIGVIVPVFVSYVGHKRITFKSNRI